MPAPALVAAALTAAAVLHPFGQLVEAESYDAGHGVRIFADATASGGHAIAFSTGDWLRYGGVDFGRSDQASGYAEWRSCATGPGEIDLRLDSPTAAPQLALRTAASGCTQWSVSSLRLGGSSTPTGVHDLYITATAPGHAEFYRLDSFQMIQQTGIPIP